MQTIVKNYKNETIGEITIVQTRGFGRVEEGTNKVKYTATDAAGNSRDCIISVSVQR